MNDAEEDLEPESPQSLPPTNSPNPRSPEHLIENSDSEEENVRYRTLTDIYSNTQERVIVEDDTLMMIDEPTCYREAAIEDCWNEAMKQEIVVIEKNRTWILTDLPPGKTAIGLKWIFKIKKDAEGNIIKHKARLVAKGYVQQQGIDFEETFAPVAKFDTIKVIIAIAATRGWEIHHLDIKSAFLNGELQEEVFVAQQKGSK